MISYMVSCSMQWVFNDHVAIIYISPIHLMLRVKVIQLMPRVKVKNNDIRNHNDKKPLHIFVVFIYEGGASNPLLFSFMTKGHQKPFIELAKALNIHGHVVSLHYGQ
jgi:hypothetical protein